VSGTGLTVLVGGFSGETFVADAGGERTVVRIYGGRGRERGVEASTIDAAVLRLVRGLLPVPEVLEVRRPVGQAPGLLVTSFLPGIRLDLLLPDAGATELNEIGRRLGDLLARLACMPMPRHGLFIDGDLSVEPFPEGDLADFVAANRTGTALADWPAQEYDALLELADHAQALLDGIGRTCLVHSDFNPKNLLVDPATLRVTGPLDWEFAHSGHPFTDLGNVLRFDRRPAYADAVLGAWCERRGGNPDQALDLARAADLWALVDLASRAGQNPVADRAHAHLLAIARSGDLHAQT
jgi:aminoglycoside phosphotransferase (APT) family kinase protein